MIIAEIKDIRIHTICLLKLALITHSQMFIGKIVNVINSNLNVNSHIDLIFSKHARKWNHRLENKQTNRKQMGHIQIHVSDTNNSYQILTKYNLINILRKEKEREEEYHGNLNIDLKTEIYSNIVLTAFWTNGKTE